MGCDIHSLAEVRDPETGTWSKIGNVFPYPWSFRTVLWSRELYAELPEIYRDAMLLDEVEHLVRLRYKPREYADNKPISEEEDYFPAIPRASELEAKVIEFGEEMASRLKVARETPHTEDPNAWMRKRYAYLRELGSEAELTDSERETLLEAVLAFTWSDDDSSGADISAHRCYGSGWFAKYRVGHPEADPDGPEYSDEAYPMWKPEWNVWDEPLDSRNYTLFAALANVRNEGGGVEPISEPRGVPEDATPEWLKVVEDWGVDMHSHSWLTLADLEAYDLDGDVRYTGIVSETQYHRLLSDGYGEDPYVGPNSWSGWIAGAGIVVFTEDGYEKWNAQGQPFLRQPEGVSIFADDIPVSAALIPDSLEPLSASLSAAPAFARNPTELAEARAGTATAGRVDLWREQGMSDEQIRSNLEGDNWIASSDQRYSYNGIKPYVQISWLRKRDTQLGEEFHSMVQVFRDIVDGDFAANDGSRRDLGPEDVRVCFGFDN